MLDSDNQTIKDILLNSGVCAEDQMQEIEEEHYRTGKPLKEIAVDFQIVTDDQMLEILATSLGMEIVDLNTVDPPKSVIEVIDGDTARMMGVCPIQEEDGVLTVAVRNPLNYQIADELRFMLNRDVVTLIASEAQVDQFIDAHYPLDIVAVHDMLSEMDGLSGDLSEGYDPTDAENLANEAPIIKFVNAVMLQAIKDKASDIHFEPFEKEFKIRCRVDGALYEMAPPPKSLAVPVISRVKILSGLNISERRKPQDGRIQLKIGGKPIDLRVSCLPTAHGESVVLRVLDRSVVNLDLDALGINEKVLEKIRQIINMPNGIFIITGPTGSGKTTTLYSALKEINKVEDKILTAEDPVVSSSLRVA